jgi:hypothetical protein
LTATGTILTQLFGQNPSVALKTNENVSKNAPNRRTTLFDTFTTISVLMHVRSVRAMARVVRQTY